AGYGAATVMSKAVMCLGCAGIVQRYPDVVSSGRPSLCQCPPASPPPWGQRALGRGRASHRQGAPRSVAGGRSRWQGAGHARTQPSAPASGEDVCLQAPHGCDRCVTDHHGHAAQRWCRKPREAARGGTSPTPGRQRATSWRSGTPQPTQRRRRHMTKNGWRRALLGSALGALLGLLPGSARATGFQLFEQNASGLGNAYAGQAAAAEDASAIYFNPAGLTRLPGGQVVGALHLIKPASTFSTNESCTPYVGTGVGTNTCPFGPHGNLGHVASGNGGNAGDWSVVPNAYLSWEVLPSTGWLGLGVN